MPTTLMPLVEGVVLIVKKMLPGNDKKYSEYKPEVLCKAIGFTFEPE